MVDGDGYSITYFFVLVNKPNRGAHARKLGIECCHPEYDQHAICTSVSLRYRELKIEIHFELQLLGNSIDLISVLYNQWRSWETRYNNAIKSKWAMPPHFPASGSARIVSDIRY